MTPRIRNGWIEGALPGPNGPIEVHRDASPPYPPLAEVKPNLVLHTTQTKRLASWAFPPQFSAGEGIVVQHRPTWAKGEALRGDTTNDPYAMQIEIVGFSKLDVWLPPKASLDPLVALVAFLHSEGAIRTGLDRPTNWPTKLDRGPQAREDYYRRHAGIWPQRAGVYGHVDIPENTHWDPGSFDYPRFFAMVRAVLEGNDMEILTNDEQKALRNFLVNLQEGLGEDVPGGAAGKRTAKAVKASERGGAPADGHTHPHEHEVAGTAK